MNDEIEIVDYAPEFHSRYREINIAWIEKSYFMEPLDWAQLDRPEETILENGGGIILAKYGRQIVGTCALIKLSNGVYEMIKMAVDEKFRGMKIGWKLGFAIIEKGKELSAKKIELLSNTKGSAAAINLYRKLGFKEVPLDSNEFERADIKMELAL
jgi:ribosomal protein S18 acetylase RimI-like enzyme